MNGFQNWTSATYGDVRAAAYDRQVAGRGDERNAVSLLRELAGDGTALELGVGTGRLAIPLAETGTVVHGLDSSQGMLDELGRAPGGQRVRALLADMADYELPERFAVIWVAFNSLFLLDSQESQLRCFASAARHLAPGGRFLVEAFVPAPEQVAGTPALRVKDFGQSSMLLQTSRHSAPDQVIESLDLEITHEGFALFPTRIRYAWPEELDGMATKAGLTLESRWASWTREPFTDRSSAHVSVYRASDAAGTQGGVPPGT